MYETTMTMTGRLVDQPERWEFDGGAVKTTFRLARTERRFDRETRAWVDGATLYLSVSCRRAMAERVLVTFGKGDPVIVRGRLRTRVWEKDGRRHSVTELHATSVGPDLAWCDVSILRRRAMSLPAGAEVSEPLDAEPGESGWIGEAPPPDAGERVPQPAEAGVGA